MGRKIVQHIYYDSGVGTGATAERRVLPYLDGITGGGLEYIVRGAYRNLCNCYEEGMEIYVFGFSRGAFSACSLINHMSVSGLLCKENCSAHHEKMARYFYRKPRRSRLSANKLELDKLCWPVIPRIKCLGIFDMVGALGIPLQFMRWRK